MDKGDFDRKWSCHPYVGSKVFTYANFLHKIPLPHNATWGYTQDFHNLPNLSEVCLEDMGIRFVVCVYIQYVLLAETPCFVPWRIWAICSTRTHCSCHRKFVPCLHKSKRTLKNGRSHYTDGLSLRAHEIFFLWKELPYCHIIGWNADKHRGFRLWQFSKICRELS